MNPSYFRRAAQLSTALLVCAFAACSNNEPPPAISLDAAPKILDSKFTAAEASAKAAAAEASQALNEKNPGRAFVALQDLSARTDLTPEQRQAAAQSMIAVGKELNDAAARGDAQAKQLLELHRATK